jgi:23S rRNA (adenine2503-C2)-methyltransferase
VGRCGLYGNAKPPLSSFFTSSESMMEILFGRTLPELKRVAADLGLPSYAGIQLAEWLYKKDVTGFEEMTNLSKKAREKLASLYRIGLHEPVSMQESVDGTRKYLFAASSGKYVETAFIPDGKRNTVCISSQVGCKMGCLFCMTGKQGFQGNLTAGEILNQYRSLPEWKKLTNVVYMGMGEPLDNLHDVLRSLEILTADWGFALSPRRITVSTIGITPALMKFLEKTEVHLAVSLHSPFEEERRKLMPVQQVFPLQEVLEEIRSWDFGRQRKVSFEYILFRDYNDSLHHVNELSRILRGIRCRINLIRFHTIPDAALESPTEDIIQMFRNALNDRGILTTIRASRGQDIWAACGLLSTKRMME